MNFASGLPRGRDRPRPSLPLKRLNRETENLLRVSSHRYSLARKIKAPNDSN